MPMWWRGSPTTYRRGWPAIAVPGCSVSRICALCSRPADTSRRWSTRRATPGRTSAPQAWTSPIRTSGSSQASSTRTPGGHTSSPGAATAAARRRTHHNCSAAPVWRHWSRLPVPTCSNTEHREGVYDNRFRKAGRPAQAGRPAARYHGLDTDNPGPGRPLCRRHRGQAVDSNRSAEGREGDLTGNDRAWLSHAVTCAGGDFAGAADPRADGGIELWAEQSAVRAAATGRVTGTRRCHGDERTAEDIPCGVAVHPHVRDRPRRSALLL